jgi:hypothetical protein
MRRSIRLCSASLLLIAAVGCSKKQDTAQQSTVDSLLASNPTEQSSGDITPQTEFKQQAQQQPPAQAPAPVAKTASTKPRTTTSTPKQEPGVTVPQGTAIKVAVSAHITSETAQPGDAWTGTVQEPIIIGDRVAIPAGSTVSGVVSGAKAAEKGSRAFLVLSVRSIEANGKSYPVSASADSMIAGSTRARNIGGIAGGAAAGALLGKAIGGSNKGALIGGLLGGAAATGAVAASKGYQAEVKEGAEITFSVNNSVTMR